MNGIAEVREEYKQAVRQRIQFPSVAFHKGKVAGLGAALDCLGVNSDDRQEICKTCEEEAEHDRIHQAATDAANQIEREKKSEQEELDATERPVAQARVEKEAEQIKKCCGYVPTLWGLEDEKWVYVCQECGVRQYEEVSI